MKKNLELSEQFERSYGRKPAIAVVRVGTRADDLAYERGIKKQAEKAGMSVFVHELPVNADEDGLISVITKLNKDKLTDGILLFLPLPKHLDERKIVNSIAPEKDLDGMTDASRLGVYAGTGTGFPPCTAQAVMEILDHYQIPMEGKRAVIIGRSLVIGKPLSMMLLKRNATVTVCHSKTEHPEELAKEADILVSAAGRIGMVTKDYVKAGQTVIDVGINFNEAGKMTGDVLFDEVSPIVENITPVPGGVGSVTTAVLLSHAVSSQK